MAKRPLSILAGDLEERLAREATETIEAAARARKKPPVAKPPAAKAPPAKPPAAKPAPPLAARSSPKKPTPKKPLAVRPAAPTPSQGGAPDWDRSKSAQSLRLAGVFRRGGNPDAARHNLLKAYEARMAGENARQAPMAFATYEQTPFADANHLSGLLGDESARARFSADPRGSWTDRRGKDLIYKALGYEQAPTVSATGVYTPPSGVLENNPASVARPFVSLQDGMLDAPSRQAMELAERLRAYTDVQGAGAGHFASAYAPPETAASVFVPQDSQVPKEMLTSLSDLGARYGLPSPVDGLYEPMFERRVSEADDAPYHAPGSGGLTDALQELMLRYPPETMSRLDASPELRAAYAGKLARDEDYAAQGFGQTREDVQRARQIMSDEGLSGLFAARKRGEELPGIMIPLLGTGAAATVAGQERGE